MKVSVKLKTSVFLATDRHDHGNEATSTDIDGWT